MSPLLFSVSIIIITITPTTYGEQCTEWYKNANNTLPHHIVDFITKLIPKYIPVVTTNNDIFDIKSANEDFNRGLENEDIHWNITQLIKHYGYPAEEHEATTSDGFVLGMFRIPGKGPVVFIMHELCGSSDDFVTSGEERALALILAKEGYDVWLGNARGNVHSRRNIHLSPDCREFWEFSFDDVGRKDLPAMIDYILEETNHKSLHYIGYSQGTTAFFVLCSEKPEYNEKISMMISLGAVAWMSHAPNFFLKVLAFLVSLFPGNTSIYEYFNGYEVLPRNEVTNAVADYACSTPETAKIFCTNLLLVAFGFDYPQVNATYLPRMYAHLPAGCSTKELLHYGQEVLSGKFRQFDYGVLENLKRYGSIYPPDYPVHKITTRVVIFQGGNDNLVAYEDLKILINKLPNFNSSDFHNITYENFNHFDFIIANDLKTLVHDKILEILKND